MTSVPFSTAWLSGDARALALLPGSADPAARVAAARRAAERGIAPAVLEEIRAQQRDLPPDRARQHSLEKLARPGSAVVVTGQQAGLFLGPLYTVHKAVSAIVNARAVERESGVPTVPLFWLQTEDHDFHEIDHCYLPAPAELIALSGAAGRDPPLVKLAISDAGQHPRTAVAHRRLGPDVADEVATLMEVVGHMPHAAEFVPLVNATWRPGRGVAEAFLELMAHVFAGTGLLLFDPRRPAMARLLAPLYRRAIERTEAISHALVERGRALHAAGFAEQVHVRYGSPLVFLHEGTPEGPRYRLDPEPGARGERFTLVGGEGTVPRAELLRVAEEEPLRLSTSALLRPLAQDHLLPTVGYVGGPGEINYLAQEAALRPILEVPPSLAWHRARFRCSDAPTRKLLAEMGLEARDAERPRDELVLQAGRRRRDPSLPPPEELGGQLLYEFQVRLSALAPAAVQVDRKLARNVERTRASVERAVARFARRYGHALAEQDQVGAARVDRLRALLHPEGEPQERKIGLPYFACRVGTRAFVQALLDAAVPFDGTLRELAA